MAGGDFVVINPNAGSGRGEQRWIAWQRALSESLGSSFKPEIVRTVADPVECHRLLVEGLGRHQPRRVFTLSGDGGVGSVFSAMMEAGSEATITPLPAGTNDNLARTLGVPRNPRQIARFLARSRATRIPLIQGRSHAGFFLCHQAVLFLTNPDFVTIYNKLKRGLNRIGLGAYAHHLAIPLTLGRLTPARVTINGQHPLPCAGLIVSATAYLARAGALPVGATPKLFVIPMEGMIRTLVETMIRGAALAGGYAEAIAPGNPLLSICPHGQLPLLADGWTRVEFTGLDGRPLPVLPYNDGDFTPLTPEVELRQVRSPFRVATVKGSDVWRQLVRPSPPTRWQRGIRRLLFSRSAQRLYRSLLKA